jgi:3-hydroxyisobutyrate dehydrogenase-like beta-hydroxyacid dehydrogenase
MKPIMPSITPRNTKLGFIGIGYMGGRIAQRLLQAGFALTAYDRTRSKAEALARFGGEVAGDIADIAAGCDVLISCLSTDEAVESVYLEPGGALSNLPPGSLVVEMSTVSPRTARRIAKHGSDRNIPVLDVTISGSTPAAEHGELVLFGGGDRACFQAAESIFRAIARGYFYMVRAGREQR